MLESSQQQGVLSDADDAPGCKISTDRQVPGLWGYTRCIAFQSSPIPK